MPKRRGISAEVRRFPVEFRPEAVRDLADIFDRVLQASQNPVIAEGYVRRIRARCDRIGNVPYSGRPRDDLLRGLRIVPFEKRAVVAYTIVDDVVWITNIFYGGRDYEALYRRGDD